jgi:hypothetical protein
VAQGIVAVKKSGKLFQLREVLQFTPKCGEGESGRAFVEHQLRGFLKPQHLKKAKPFQFVGGKKSQYDCHTLSRIEHLIQKMEMNAQAGMRGAQENLEQLKLKRQLLSHVDSNPFENTKSLEKQATIQLTTGFEITLAKEWYEELGSVLTPECLCHITTFHGSDWELRRKIRDHQEFDVPVNYDLGRTRVIIDWATDFQARTKLEDVELHPAVRAAFEAKPGKFNPKKMQGKAAGFDWEDVGNVSKFDFVVSEDEEGGKFIVFMLVDEKWLGENDPADEVVDKWTSGQHLSVPSTSSTREEPAGYWEMLKSGIERVKRLRKATRAKEQKGSKAKKRPSQRSIR